MLLTIGPTTIVGLYERKDEGESIRELNLKSELNVSELDVKYTDVVSYYVLAWDNKEPVPQIGKTELFFVEIKDKSKEPESKSSEGEGPSSKEELDLRAVIIELKRIMRLSNESLYMEKYRRDLNRQEIGASLASLFNEGLSLIKKTKLLAPAATEFLEHLKHSFDSVKQAEGLVNEDEIKASIVKQHIAYSDLLKAESLMEQKQCMASGRQGEGGKQASPEKSQEGDQSGESGSEEKTMNMADVKDALDKINQLVDKQSEMNVRYRRAEKSKLGREELKEIAQLQNKLSQKAQDLDHTLLQFDGVLDVRAHIKRAIADMSEAESSTRTGELVQSRRSGSRAKEDLLSASDLMSGKLDQLASDELNSLAQASQQLSSGEQQAAQASQGAQSEGGSGKGQALRKEQSELRDSFDDLLSEMDKTAMDLADYYPEISQGLFDLTRETQSSGIGASMKRAENALLYERFKRASALQDGAASKLSKMSKEMQTIANQIPSMTSDQLRNLRKRIKEVQDTLTSSQSGQGEESGKGDSEGCGFDEFLRTQSNGWIVPALPTLNAIEI